VFKSLVAGHFHTCGVEAGTSKAWCWGGNWAGQLGDGTSGIDRTAPVAVTGELVFASLVAGEFHTCGVEGRTGKVWCWGSNSTGQLGDGTSGNGNWSDSANRSAPVAVSGGRVFASLAAGSDHTCGLEAGTDKAWCWGGNGYGQLGDGTSGSPTHWNDADQSAPVAVTGGRVFSSLVAGGAKTCGLDAGTGKAWCWGANGGGQLGDGTTGTDRSAPVAVTGGRVFASLVAGGGHNCGVVAGTGKAWCWGDNYFGQLGDGTTGGSSVPMAVTGGRVFASLVAGEFHTCGLEADTGKAWCWGENGAGQLGDGTTGGSSAPVGVSGGRVFASLAAGWSHTCGVEAGSGKAWCWGGNGQGQLGDGTSGDWTSAANRTAPVAVTGGRVFVSLVAGMYHTCGVESGTFKAWCWGGNNGQLGDGTSGTARTAPVAVTGGRVFASLVAGREHTCGVETTTGNVWCWGFNGSGQLGVPPQNTRTEPEAVTGGRVFASLVAGAQHTCGVESGTFKAWCWGGNWAGQLGTGMSWSNADNSALNGVPVTVTGGRVFKSLAAGTGHSCGVEAGTGMAWCWGDNYFGQLGDGTTGGSSAPVAVTGGRAFVSLVAGGDYTCGVESGTGKAWCWGFKESGQLGDGTLLHAPRLVTGQVEPSPTTQSLALDAGWSLVALPLAPSSDLTAKGICDGARTTGTNTVGSVREVARWQDGGWQSYLCTPGTGDFALEPGRGYFVRSVAPATIGVTGVPFDGRLLLDLRAGWNLVGLPGTGPWLSATGIVAAVEAASVPPGTNASPAVTEMDWWETGQWVGYIRGLPVNATKVLPDGRGAFLRLTRPSTWLLPGIVGTNRVVEETGPDR